MPNINCKICGEIFYAKPFWIRRGFGKYCSPECQHKGQKTGKLVKCFLCGKESYKTKNNLNRSKSGKFFCSKSCQTKWRNSIFFGSKHANWKGGRFAYKTVLVRKGVPQVCRICGTRDRRILAVHHLDRDKRNNSAKNLVWLCHNCHFLVHHYDVERSKL